MEELPSIGDKCKITYPDRYNEGKRHFGKTVEICKILPL